MMTIDILAALINQQHLIRCFKNLERIDEKLANEGVEIDYQPLKRLSLVLIMITVCRNFFMILFGYFGINANVFRLCAMYVPICISVLSKIYFVLIVSNIRMKFDAINFYLDELANSLNALNQHDNHNCKSRIHLSNAHQSKHSAAGISLSNEIFVKPKPKFFQILPALNLVKPYDARDFIDDDDSNNRTGNVEIPSIGRYLNEQQKFGLNEFPETKTGALVIGDRFDKRLTNLCFLHDDICEIVGNANYMFSFQMLMLMAYGFLGITSQLYFVYCSLANQVHINLE